MSVIFAIVMLVWAYLFIRNYYVQNNAQNQIQVAAWLAVLILGISYYNNPTTVNSTTTSNTTYVTASPTPDDTLYSPAPSSDNMQ